MHDQATPAEWLVVVAVTAPHVGAADTAVFTFEASSPEDALRQLADEIEANCGQVLGRA